MRLQTAFIFGLSVASIANAEGNKGATKSPLPETKVAAFHIVETGGDPAKEWSVQASCNADNCAVTVLDVTANGIGFKWQAWGLPSNACDIDTSSGHVSCEAKNIVGIGSMHPAQLEGGIFSLTLDRTGLSIAAKTKTGSDLYTKNWETATRACTFAVPEGSAWVGYRGNETIVHGDGTKTAVCGSPFPYNVYLNGLDSYPTLRCESEGAVVEITAGIPRSTGQYFSDGYPVFEQDINVKVFALDEPTKKELGKMANRTSLESATLTGRQVAYFSTFYNRFDRYQSTRSGTNGTPVVTFSADSAEPLNLSGDGLFRLNEQHRSYAGFWMSPKGEDVYLRLGYSVEGFGFFSNLAFKRSQCTVQ